MLKPFRITQTRVKTLANREIAIAQATSEQIQSLRFAEREYRTVIPYLDDILLLVKKRLANRGSVSDFEFTREIQTEIRKLLVAWESGLVDDLKSFGLEIAGSTADGLDALVKSDVFEPDLPSTAQIYSAALNNPMPIGQAGSAIFMRDILESFPINESKAAANQIRSGFVNGLTNEQIARQVKQRLNITSNHARTLTRTAVSNLSYVARDLTFKSNSDVVIGKKFVATLDDRTTNICKSLDGNIYLNKSKKKVPRLPLHYNERSTFAPVVIGDDLESGGSRRPQKGAESANKDDGFDPKAASSNKIYYEFLKSQPKWFIDDAFNSKKMGQAFRSLVKSGDMTATEFAKISIDSTFQPLTLEEMAKKNKKVNAYLKTLNNKG